MRTTLTLSVLALVGMCHVQAQTLQASMLPTTTVNMDWYTGTGIGNEGAANGAGVTWDFSAVALDPTGIPLTFGPASQTPYAAQYPTAQYAQGITYGPFHSYDYLKISGNKLELFVEGVPDDVNVFINPQTVLEFPLNLGNSFTDIIDYGEGPFQFTTTYAGNGTLLTSLGTYTNVVKLVTSDETTIFWNTNPLYQIAVALDDGYFDLYRGGSGVGIAENATGTPALLWPNPTTGMIHIEGQSGLVEWNLIDVLGRNVLSGKSFIGDGKSIDVGAAPAGSYQLLLNSGDRVLSMPLVRQ